MSNPSKRGPLPPTGDTPGKKTSKQRREATSKKALFQTTTSIQNAETHTNEWGTDEISALIQFIALYHTPDSSLGVWPTHKRDTFWNNCSKAIYKTTGKKERSGNACRQKVGKFLRVKFKTLEDAEEAYNIDYFSDFVCDEPITTTPPPRHRTGQVQSPMLGFSPLRNTDTSEIRASVLDAVTSGFVKLTPRQRKQLLIFLFHKWLILDIDATLQVDYVPKTFLPLAANSMKVLRANKKKNLMYHASRCFGEFRPGESQTRMPLNRMPFGMISHNLCFFSMDSVPKLEAPEDYRSWCQTMYTLFGNKWASLHCGPMWSYKSEPTHELPHTILDAASGSSGSTSVLSDVHIPTLSLPLLSTETTLCDIGSFPGMSATPTPPSLTNAPVPLTYETTSCEVGSAPVMSVTPQSLTTLPAPLASTSSTSTHVLPSETTLPEMLPNSSTPSSSSNIISEAMALAFSAESPIDQLLCQDLLLPDSAPENTSTSSTVVQPSSLWSVLTEAERRENEDSNISFHDLEVMHGIRPGVHVTKNTERNPLKAKVNIAAPSARTIRRTVVNSNFTKGSEIQVSALNHVHKINPKSRWWIKADGTDIQSGLRESVRNEWSGDIDWGDGALQKCHKEYLDYLSSVQSIGKRHRNSPSVVKVDLQKQRQLLLEERRFLQQGLETSRNTYEQKRKQLNISEESLFAIAWDLEGYTKLLEINHTLSDTINNILQRMLGEPSDTSDGHGIPSILTKLRTELSSYIKGLYLKKRDAASHLLLFMISDDQRSHKPYAIPVRVLKYKTITDAKLRELKEELKVVMKEVGMTPVGFVTDGEFNSLRTQGSNRPVSVIQLLMDSKAEARSIPVKDIERMIKPIYEGGIHTAQDHPAVPMEDIIWLAEFMANGREILIPFIRAIHILHRKQYPIFYDPHPWIPGKTETKGDCLKSLMAIYIYRHKIKSYDLEGVDFKHHLYVPECDPDNFVPQHEREDHNHVLKRIATCLRNGTIPGVNMRGFVEAMNDAHTGLTYTALTGKRKQSVNDAEKLLSGAVSAWLNEHGYSYEGRFLGIVANWHKASDGRGLSEDLRRQYNCAMLDFLLEDWMPWFKYNRDFSTLDPNRPMKGIQGLTRELIVALTTNIESQEHSRLYGIQRGLPPEHPRASSTDDVEGIFAFLHELLGNIFDEKQFHDTFPKVMLEYTKKCDPNLSFYHYTGGNERYSTGPATSFNVPSASGVERLDRVQISRRADPGVFVANRAVLPQRGQLTVRSAHFRPAEHLPPPPQQQ